MRLVASLSLPTRRTHLTRAVGGHPHGDTGDAHRQRLLASAALLEEQIACDQATIAEREAAGVKLWGPQDFTRGDRVEISGSRATVDRVNPQTLIVRYDIWPENPIKVQYAKVTGKHTGR